MVTSNPINKWISDKWISSLRCKRRASESTRLLTDCLIRYEFRTMCLDNLLLAIRGSGLFVSYRSGPHLSPPLPPASPTPSESLPHSGRYTTLCHRLYTLIQHLISETSEKIDFSVQSQHFREYWRLGTSSQTQLLNRLFSQRTCVIFVSLPGRLFPTSPMIIALSPPFLIKSELRAIRTFCRLSADSNIPASMEEKTRQRHAFSGCHNR